MTDLAAIGTAVRKVFALKDDGIDSPCSTTRPETWLAESDTHLWCCVDGRWYLGIWTDVDPVIVEALSFAGEPLTDGDHKALAAIQRLSASTLMQSLVT